MLPDESRGKHVLRYLRTLTAWYAAAITVVPKLRATKRPLDVYVVELSDDSQRATEDATRHLDDAIAFVKAEIGDIAVQKRVEAWMKKRPIDRNPQLHAEAGLMALPLYIKHIGGDDLPLPAELLPVLHSVCSSATSQLCILLTVHAGRYPRDRCGQEMLLHVPPPVEVSIQGFVFFQSARLFWTEVFRCSK